MANNKYDFIKELLLDKKISQKQRERIFELTSKEISLQGTLDERIKKIEEIVLKGNIDVVEEKPKIKQNKTSEKLPNFYYNSKYTYNFLEDFNQDQILSTTCHLIDNNTLITLKEDYGFDEYNFEKHYELILSSFKKLIEKYDGKIDYKLIALINGYLKGGANWAGNINLNWGMENLLIWSKNNLGIPPNPDKDVKNDFDTKGFNQFNEIQPKLKLVKIEGVPISKISNFNHLVNHFKYLFHVRKDNNLKDIIENNLLSKWSNDIDICTKRIDEYIEYFLDADKLIQAIKNIFKLIIEVKEKNGLAKPDVALSFYYENGDVCFAIHHKNTHFIRRIDEINRMGDSIPGLIKNQINGMGEFEIKACFPDKKSYNIKYWDFKVYKKRKPYWQQIKNLEGVKYIIRMKK